MTDGRTEPPQQAGERQTLTCFLDWQRAALAGKCQGLAGEQPGLSLLGLARHLAGSRAQLVSRRAVLAALDPQPHD